MRRRIPDLTADVEALDADVASHSHLAEDVTDFDAQARIAVGGVIEDTAYGAGWNGDTDAPSKNAVYDKIETLSAGSGLTAEQVIDLVHPVGSLYVSTISTNPGTLFGFGTWTAFGAGKVLVGIDSGDTDFDTVEETGGAKTVASAGTNANESAHTHDYSQVLNHTHTVNINDPGHTHTADVFATDANGANFDRSAGGGAQGTATTNSNTTGITATTDNPAGGAATGTTAAGSAHTHTYTGSATSVVQPYIVVYMFKRTA